MTHVTLASIITAVLTSTLHCPCQSQYPQFESIELLPFGVFGLGVLAWDSQPDLPNQLEQIQTEQLEDVIELDV
jgi:hypothetical protein